jgi:pyruvate,water dikinase
MMLNSRCADCALCCAGEEALLRTVRRVFASLYTNRAISYRVHHGFEHSAVALSAGIQKMVRADLGASGVIFTLDTESGFPDVCMVTGAWGLGETVVQARATIAIMSCCVASQLRLSACLPAVARRAASTRTRRVTPRAVPLTLRRHPS